MTPQEKDLIQGVFDRLAAIPASTKDADADRLIREQAQRNPDATYGLVQAVVMLEAGLNQAQTRIAALQRQLEQAGGGAAAPSGNFLGGGPWGGTSVPRSGAPQPQAAAYAPQPAMAAPVAGPWSQPSGGSSFLRNAATMAAGVAGGTLIAEGLSSLFGGHHGGFGGYGGGFGGGYGGPSEVVEQVTVNNYYDDQSGGGTQDASYDSSDSDYGSGYDDSSDA
jgi:hypothetical protein